MCIAKYQAEKHLNNMLVTCSHEDNMFINEKTQSIISHLVIFLRN